MFLTIHGTRDSWQYKSASTSPYSWIFTRQTWSRNWEYAPRNSSGGLYKNNHSLLKLCRYGFVTSLQQKIILSFLMGLYWWAGSSLACGACWAWSSRHFNPQSVAVRKFVKHCQDERNIALLNRLQKMFLPRSLTSESEVQLCFGVWHRGMGVTASSSKKSILPRLAMVDDNLSALGN